MPRSHRALLALSFLLALLPSSPAQAANFERVAGPDRFATAAQISQRAFEPGVAAAYVVTGLDFPDALAAAPAAAAAGAPLLLVTASEVPAPTAQELSRLQPGRIVVVGNPKAVSEEVIAALRSHTKGAVERRAGADQFATAAAVATASFQSGVSTVFVANGRNFPDGLSGGAAAGALGGPVLFVETDGLPAVTAQALDSLRPSAIVILGGPAAVSQTVEGQLGRYSPSVQRYAGPSRFTTSAAVAHAVFPNAVDTVYLATGGAFPDALAGGPAAAAAGAPLLLTNRDCIPAAIDAQIDRLQPSTVVVLGGPSAISDAVLGRKPCAEPVVVLEQDLEAATSGGECARDIVGGGHVGSGQISGETFPHMLWCELGLEENGFREYDLGRRFGAFEVTIGQRDDSELTTETVEWRVLVDGVEVASHELGFGEKQRLRIGVPNALRLRLEVVRVSNDENWQDVPPAWGNPRLLP